MDDYLNPALTDPERNQLRWQHYVMAQLTQAAAGNIGTEMLGLFVAFARRDITLHVVSAAGHQASCRRAGDTIVRELEDLLDQTAPGVSTVELVVHEEPPPADWPLRDWWIAYRARTSDNSYGTGRFAEVGVPGAEAVASRDDVVDLLERMLTDLRQSHGEWENHDLERYLEALQGALDALDRLYANRGERLSEQPTWRQFAEALYLASGYE